MNDAVYSIMLASFVLLALFGMLTWIGIVQTDWKDDSMFAFFIGTFGALILYSVDRLV